jgi:hypothetical protein
MAKLRNKVAPREIRDIRFPTSHVPEKSAASEAPVRKVRLVPAPIRKVSLSSRRRFPIRLIVIFFCLALVTAVAVGFFWYRDKAEQASHIQKALVEANLSTPSSSLPSSLGGWLSLIKGLFADVGGTFGNSPLQAIGALDSASTLLKSIPSKLFENDGPGVATGLSGLGDNLRVLGDFLKSISENGEGPYGLSGLSEYAAYAPDVERARIATERLLLLLKSPGQHHVLVLFGNSAELRPGGGFLGSFADISFGDSEIEGVVVRDVNEVDRGLAANIVPPKPMQGIVTRWRSADANWFFDYPESAQKTLELMSRSSFYASSTLDGAILISPKVVQDLLSATGPIVLDDGKTTVSAETVIPMIQSEVQAGQASGAENPKEILAKLLPPLEEKLQNLKSEEFDKLMALARNWISNKDLAIFMADPELMKIVSYYHADGGSYVVPQSFSGDYFAAVNANLGGGKSDARISDTIDLESDLRADGVIENHVAVIRENNAAASDAWWYRVTNQNYLQVFTPAGATLTAATGGRARVIIPRTNYSKGFERDPDVAALESTLKPVAGFAAVSQFRESDKNVFATWLTTPVGKSSAARFEYRRSLRAPFYDGQEYTFVFERQSGARQSLRAILNAPPGFIWKESGLSEYEYFTEAVPGRVVLSLTLLAI